VQDRDGRADRRDDDDVPAAPVRIGEPVPAVQRRDVAAVEAGNRQERDAGRARAQAGDDRDARMLLELELPVLDRAAVGGEEAALPVHGSDADARAAQRTCPAEKIEVVARRRLDEFEPGPAAGDERPHERTRRPVEEAPAESDHGAVFDARRELFEREERRHRRRGYAPPPGPADSLGPGYSASSRRPSVASRDELPGP
jgi:hypothetical protein